MNIKIYTISQICKELDITQNKIRYIEEKIGYTVARDNFGNRQYTEADLFNFKEFLRMHIQGKMSYEVIKIYHYNKVKNSECTTDDYNEAAATNDFNQVETSEKENSVVSLVNDVALREYMDKMQKTFGVIVDRLDTVVQINEKLDKLDELESKIDKMQSSMDAEVSELQERIIEELRVSQISQDLKALLAEKKKESAEKNKGWFSWFKK